MGKPNKSEKQISIVFHLIDRSQVRCKDEEWQDSGSFHKITKQTKDSTGINEETTFIPSSSVVKIVKYESELYE